MNDLIRKVEAILFAASKRMSIEELEELLEDSKREDIESALNDLIKEYQENENSSLIVLKEEDTWKLSLRDEYLPFAEKLMPSTDLPKAIVETLAIIAWKSPVMQSDLVKLRSAVVYEHIAELEKLKLIVRTKKGRSYVVRVTDKFYDYFDLPQQKAEEVFGQYEEPKPEDFPEESNVFNKGDSFDESVDEKDKRLMKEIRENTIDPEAIIKEDKEFLEDFDKRLEEIETQSSQANDTLKEMDSIEDEMRERNGVDVEERFDEMETQKKEIENQINENLDEENKIDKEN